MMIKVLFVCLGNICRSPTAHGIFTKQVEQHKLAKHIYVDSAGTGDWHAGEAPDMRAIKAASKRGYDLSMLKARQVTLNDFAEFDYIIAMDGDNMRNLLAICPEHYQHKVNLLLNYGEHDVQHVPDPYYGDSEGFEKVIDLIEGSTEQLLIHIKNSHLK
jgi:protein-tyrosine phosphatase